MLHRGTSPSTGSFSQPPVEHRSAFSSMGFGQATGSAAVAAEQQSIPPAYQYGIAEGCSTGLQADPPADTEFGASSAIRSGGSRPNTDKSTSSQANDATEHPTDTGTTVNLNGTNELKQLLKDLFDVSRRILSPF